MSDTIELLPLATALRKMYYGAENEAARLTVVAAATKLTTGEADMTEAMDASAALGYAKGIGEVMDLILAMMEENDAGV